MYTRASMRARAATDAYNVARARVARFLRAKTVGERDHDQPRPSPTFET